MQATKTAVKDHSKEMPHILVVDDERSICELLEITFRKEGYRIEVAHNVEAAKRKLESQIFDIVISDVRMPGESGVDLLKVAGACGIGPCLDVRDEAALAELARRLKGLNETLFARVLIAPEEPPRVLPLRDGVALKQRFRAAIGVESRI